MNKLPLIFFLVLSLLQLDCKKDPVASTPDEKPDTTSHNFTFTTYTFGGNGGSSFFKDVAIINDNLIYATGQIFTNDSLGQNQTYGIAVWNGTDWKLKQLYYTSSGNTFVLSNIRGIQYISLSEIWFAAGSIFRWDGISSQTQLSLSRLTFTDPNASVEKLWGSSKNLYGVGNAGTIVHFDGLTWKKQESGTTIDLRDVWGSSDAKTVWASGWSNDDDKSILLRYDGIAWKTVWQRVGTVSQLPYGFFATSVYGDKSLFVAAGRAVHRTSVADTTQMTTLPWFPYRIRGSGENNIAVAGDNGMIWHYNGSTWKELHLKENQPFYSVAVSKNIIAAVGSDNSSFLSSGLIYLGRK